MTISSNRKLVTSKVEALNKKLMFDHEMKENNLLVNENEITEIFYKIFFVNRNLEFLLGAFISQGVFINNDSSPSPIYQINSPNRLFLKFLKGSFGGEITERIPSIHGKYRSLDIPIYRWSARLDFKTYEKNGQNFIDYSDTITYSLVHFFYYRGIVPDHYTNPSQNDKLSNFLNQLAKDGLWFFTIEYFCEQASIYSNYIYPDNTNN